MYIELCIVEFLALKHECCTQVLPDILLFAPAIKQTLFMHLVHIELIGLVFITNVCNSMPSTTALMHNQITSFDVHSM